MRANRTIILVGILAFCTRMFFALSYQGPVYYKGIAGGYLQLADNVLDGRGLVVQVDVAPVGAGQSNLQYVESIDRPLGYLFLVLLPYWVFSALGIQLFQAVLSAISAVLLYRIALRIFSEKVAVWAGLIYALWPLSGRFEIAILPDAVMPFFLILGTWLLLIATASRKPAPLFLLSGVIYGLGMMMRPDISLLPFFIIALYFVAKELRVQSWLSFLLLAGVLIAVAPQTVRNYRITGGKLVPLGLGNGISLWEGISPFGDTLGTVYGDEKMVEREGFRSWAYPDGVERDQRRFREAVGIILDHPWWYAKMMGRRIPVVLIPDGIIAGKFMPPPKEFFRSNPEAGFARYFSAYPLGTLVQLTLIAAQLGLLFFATLATIRSWRKTHLWIPAVIVLYYILVHLATNAEPRYFYPAIPFVILLGAEGLQYVLGQSNKT